MHTSPFVDEHRTSVGASPERTFDALMSFVRHRFAQPAPSLVARVWRLSPSSGFAVAEEAAPRHIALRGHHRFSRYELAFDIEPRPDGATLIARTFAEFPGIAGHAYRALVIGSGGHALIVRAMLRGIARAARVESRSRVASVSGSGRRGRS